MKRLVDAVLLADVAAGENAVGAEQGAQIVEHPRGRGLREAPALR